MRGLDGPHACFPMLVAQSIPNRVGLGPCAEQTPEVAGRLEVTDWQQHHDAQEDHGLAHPLVVSSPARPSLHEKDEVGHVG